MENYIESVAHAKKPGPRIIIGGGSITGLTLALMLEKLGIDFIVLEAHETIAAEVGAGTACHANGFRILDQLGLYDDILSASKAPVQEYSVHWTDGTLNFRNEGFSEVLERVVGFPMVVLDRQQLLAIMYNHIRDKSKVVAGEFDQNSALSMMLCSF